MPHHSRCCPNSVFSLVIAWTFFIKHDPKYFAMCTLQPLLHSYVTCTPFPLYYQHLGFPPVYLHNPLCHHFTEHFNIPSPFQPLTPDHQQTSETVPLYQPLPTAFHPETLPCLPQYVVHEQVKQPRTHHTCFTPISTPNQSEFCPCIRTHASLLKYSDVLKMKLQYIR